MVQRPPADDAHGGTSGGSTGGGGGGQQREPSSSRMGISIGYSSYQNAGYNKLFTQVYRRVISFRLIQFNVMLQSQLKVGQPTIME